MLDELGNVHQPVDVKLSATGPDGEPSTIHSASSSRRSTSRGCFGAATNRSAARRTSTAATATASLYLHERRPHLVTTVDWTRTVIHSPDPLPEEAVELQAILSRDGVQSLQVDGKPVATTPNAAPSPTTL